MLFEYMKSNSNSMPLFAFSCFVTGLLAGYTMKSFSFGAIKAKKTLSALIKEPLKMVLIVRTDLKMGKGIFYNIYLEL